MFFMKILRNSITRYVAYTIIYRGDVMKPTIKKVAEVADVSIATVSRVINGQGGYNDQTQKRVLKAIEILGYQGNYTTHKATREQKKDKIIGVLSSSLTTYFYSDVICGLEGVASQNGYSVMIFNTREEKKDVFEYIQLLLQRNISGIMVIGLKLDNESYALLKQTKIPVIQISTMSYQYQIPYIKVDSYQAAYAGVSYLIKQGHQSIAMISGSFNDLDAGRNRLNAYKQALVDNGLVIDEGLVEFGDFTYESGIECTKRLFDKKKNFTAIFAASDDMAIGALTVAYEKQLKVPDDLSVLGYDNTRIAKMAIPRLTTVAQPFEEMGEKAMKQMISKLEMNEEIFSIIMPFKIIERNTVKKLIDNNKGECKLNENLI